MKPPPSDPKKPAPPRADDESWDDALGDRAHQTISPDVVRKLLEMNPALREQGMNTGHMLNQAQRAQTAAAQGEKVKPMTSQPQSDIFAAFTEFKQTARNDKQRIDTELARLKQEQAKSIAAMKERVTRWIVANDPDMRSPVTQKVLKNEAEFLKMIGFSVDAYVDERLGKPKR